jgi:hypothetical protein
MPTFCRGGLKMQCKALVMDGLEDRDEPTARFVGNFVLYFGMELPDRLTAHLLNNALAWSDETEDDEEGDEA